MCIRHSARGTIMEEVRCKNIHMWSWPRDAMSIIIISGVRTHWQSAAMSKFSIGETRRPENETNTGKDRGIRDAQIGADPTRVKIKIQGAIFFDSPTDRRMKAEELASAASPGTSIPFCV